LFDDLGFSNPAAAVTDDEARFGAFPALFQCCQLFGTVYKHAQPQQSTLKQSDLK
jgi:hypothetical protein